METPMEIKKFRKKPVVIEALQWVPTKQGLAWMQLFVGDHAYTRTHSTTGELQLICKTLEGELRATPGDWIIRGVKGEFYPCKPDIFEATYEPVRE